MEKILVIDTETCNTFLDDNGKLDMSNVLMYDCGWAVVDTARRIYETASFVNRDIFVKERELMRSAYYANKIPKYIEDIQNGCRIMADGYEIRQTMLETIQKYNITTVAAFNTRFDYNALNTTQKWCTKSKYRYWFPFDSVELWDIMKMATDVILPMSEYQDFCTDNGYLLKNGKPRKTAEILYKFISNNVDFEEAHTGLEDVIIEAEIMWYCFEQDKPMQKILYKERRNYPENTDFQRNLLLNLKMNPTVNIGMAK